MYNPSRIWPVRSGDHKKFNTNRVSCVCIHYYKKSFAMRFKNDLKDEQAFKPPRLMPVINRGGYFSLTEAVTANVLAKSIYRGGYNVTISY